MTRSPRRTGRAPADRGRGLRPVEPRRLAGDRDPGDAGQLRGPAGRHHRAVADLRASSRRPARPVGPPAVAALRRGRASRSCSCRPTPDPGTAPDASGPRSTRPPAPSRRPESHWFAGDHDIHAQHPDEVADLFHARRDRRVPCAHDRPARPGDHGLGRDRADDGQGPPRAVRAVRRPGRAGRAARHAVRLPGERRRAIAPGPSSYFAESVGPRHRRRHVPVARRRRRSRRDGRSPASREAALRLRRARAARRYALRQWAGGPIPDALADKLARRRLVTLASAAALTLGRRRPCRSTRSTRSATTRTGSTGLDLLGAATGLRAAVVPHYDNAEGGNHDTRFCYLGERRLRVLEALLPATRSCSASTSHTGAASSTSRPGPPRGGSRRRHRPG